MSAGCLTIGKKKVGHGQPTFIIAELSGNHNHDIKRAYAMIDAAVDAGVDAIKLQTYTPDTMTIDCDNDYFQVKVNDAWKGKTLYSLYQEACTPWEWHAELKKYAESKGVIIFSTPFDISAVDFLETLDMPLYKISSFETGDIEFIEHVGKTGKPVLISRGLTSLKELERAVSALNKVGCRDVGILQCISSYPATPDQMNLATIPDIANRFGVVAGLSDHSMDSLGIVVPLVAVSLGASIVEKHFTLKRSDGGPDAAFSLEPQEMKSLVKTIREAEKAIGKPTYDMGKKEAENLVFRRSIFITKDIKKGDLLTRDNIKVIRPGYGLAPVHLTEVLGREIKVDIKRGTPLTWEMLI